MTFMLMSTLSRQMAHTISSTGLTKDEFANTEDAAAAGAVVADILQVLWFGF
jgi:hypothetical protein